MARVEGLQSSGVFVGQPLAVAAVGKALASNARDDDFATGGLDGSPLVLAFLGPSGVGKTELARQIAVILHGDAETGEQTPEQLEAAGKLKRFPMNQYQTKESLANLLGADKGHVGQCNGALTNALRAVPDAVIVLDEFEKADASFADACFLNAFGADGFFQDSCADNSRVPTGRATFVITSNFASELLVLDEATALAEGLKEDQTRREK